MPRIFEWKCSYYNEKCGKWLYGNVRLYQRYIRFKADAGKLAMKSLSIDLRNITEVKRKTTNLFFNALVISERGVHHHWFSSLNNVYNVLNIIEHFWRATVLGSFDDIQRKEASESSRKNELLEIAYDSQATLVSAATTLHSQGEQIRNAAKKMDMLHSDLEVAEHIVSDMESWFGYWKVASSNPVLVRGQEFSILAAKTQQESHTASKLILGTNSINIYGPDNKEIFEFYPNDLENTLVHSPYEVTFSQRHFGKPDIKAHIVSTQLPNLLRYIQKLYKKNLSYESAPTISDDEDDNIIEVDQKRNSLSDLRNTGRPWKSFGTRNQLIGSATKQKSASVEVAGQIQTSKESQFKILNESDANELTGVLKNMKEMALDINREQDLQIEQLDKLGLSVEKAEAKVQKDNQVIRGMLRR